MASQRLATRRTEVGAAVSPSPTAGTWPSLHSSIDERAAVYLMQTDPSYWEVLCEERNRADDEGSIFMACVRKNSHDEVNQDAEGFPEPAQRIVALDNKTNLFIFRFAHEQDCKRIDGISGTFRYPSLPAATDQTRDHYFRLENIFFRPTPFWKRMLDLIVAGAILFLLSPVLLVVCLLIKVGSDGPVIFKQRRLGGAGLPFTIWKLRTLRSDVCTNQHQSYVTKLTQNGAPLSKIDYASRLVPCGKLLRACCADELPQLVNVLQGHMSLVGPRPDVLDYDDYTPRQRRRFDVVPGMTGLWQVNGKNKTTFEQMITYDSNYVRNRSPKLDLWIMLVTLPAMVRQVLDEKSI